VLLVCLQRLIFTVRARYSESRGRQRASTRSQPGGASDSHDDLERAAALV